MNQEDLKNLTGWLEAIYKETQVTRGVATELRKNVDMIPDIRHFTDIASRDSSDSEKKIEETRNHLENRLSQIESMLNELRSQMKDIHSKIDHLR